MNSIRNQRQMLWATAGTLSIATIVAWSLALFRISKDEVSVKTPTANTTMVAAKLNNGFNQEEQSQSSKLAEAAKGIDLLRPLFDPPPKPAPLTPTLAPPVRLKLIGTVYGQSEPQAILSTADGRTIFARVGEIIDGTRIDVVSQDAVDITHHNQSRTLRISRD